MDWSPYALDAVAAGAIVGALALVMFAAAWHKLSQVEVFAGALSAYGLLPQASIRPMVRVLPAIEAALGVGLLVPATRAPALLALGGLLLVYAAAMGINLARGRQDIDCGCGAGSHPLSWGLVARNGVLAGAALAASSPAPERPMDPTDGLTLVLGVLSLYALYLLSDELLRQASRLARLDRREGGQG